MQEGTELMQAWEAGEGISGGIAEVGREFARDWNDAPNIKEGVKAAGRNLRAMGEGIAEQTANMIAPVTGMITGGIAGTKTGGAIGAIGGPKGAVAGGVIGGLAGAWGGASIGNAAIEGGGITQQAIQEAGIDPADLDSVKAYLDENSGTLLKQAGIKGGIIGAIDTATAGIAGRLLNGPARAASSRILASLGVDTADKAAVKAAKESPAFAQMLAQDAAYQASRQGAEKIARNVAAAAIDPAGEFAGEYLGSGIALGDWDAKNAALEAFSSIGQSGVMFAGQKAYQAATGLGGKQSPLIQPQPSAENPAPAPVPAPDPNAGAISRTASMLPAPDIAGALPAPDPVMFADSQGNVSSQGPARDVDREYRPTGREQGPRDFGPGMDQAAPRGEQAPLEGQLIRGGIGAQPQPSAREPATDDNEPSLGLPAPSRAIPDMRGDNITVAPDGTAAPGKTPNTPPERYIQGGPGMDQQREVGKTYKGLPAANRAIRNSANPDQLEAVRVGPQTFEVRAKQKPAKRVVNRDRDSVMQAVIRLGGVKTEWRRDTTGDDKGNKFLPGVGALWSDKTGTGLDDMASLLDQNGYVPAGEMERDGGVSWLQQALRDEAGGMKTHAAPGSKLQEAQALKAEADRLQAQAEAIADADADLETKIDLAFDLSDDPAELERRRLASEAFAAELDALFGDSPNEQGQSRAGGSADSNPQEADSRADGDRGSAGEGKPGAVRSPDARAEGESEVTPALELQSQTEQELAEADAATKARIKAEEKAQAEADEKRRKEEERAQIKAQSEAQADNFTLGANAEDSLSGQGSILDAQPEQAQPATVTAKPDEADAQRFIAAPDGSTDFGEITSDMAKAAGRQAGKIRLQQGNESWGLQHIEQRHGAEIRDAGFADVPAFVADIAQHIDQVWKPAATRQLVALHKVGNNRMMFVELQPGKDEAGDFYTVNTAFTSRKAEKKGWKLLWEARAQASGESGNRPSFAVSPPVAGGEVTNPSSQSSEPSIAPPAGDKPAAKPKSKPAAKPGAKLEDAGEKLGGARKDQLRSVRERLDGMDDEAIAGSSLSQLWPKGELDKITDPFEAALYHLVRGYIPAKPRVPYRVRAWVDKVKAGRDILTTLGRLGAGATVERLRAESPSMNIVADEIEVLLALDRKHWGRIEKVRRASGRYNQDGEMVPGSWVSLNIDGRSVSFFGHETVASAIPAIKERVEGKSAPEKRLKFAIYTDRQTSDVFVVKEGDAEMRRLKTFKTVKEARAFLNDEHEAAVALWDAVKNRDNVTKSDMRRAANEPRVGQDHRNGKDVTPEQFIEAFGFRGVEFGNWVKQGAGGRERQGMLNDAYDAFMDLAGILNIPPKALSLEGKLGIGFGSRGSGKASAHYEPDRVVINMTKTKGAGTLAHEWFHALDNYFARRRAEQPGSGIAMTDRETAYITYRPERLWVNKKHPSMRMTRAELSRYQTNHPGAPLYQEGNWEPDAKHPNGVRPQVEKAFAELVATLNASPMLQRAKVIDGKTSDGYWSRIIERGARSFETYVIARLADQGFRNDYLANVQTLEQFSRDPGRYPYLTPDEQGPVNEAFDKLFATLETRETDLGVALFSRAGGPIDPAGLSESSMVAGKAPENPISLEQAISAAEQFLADYNGNIELSYRIRKKQDELYGPGSIAKIGVIKGAYHPGRGLFTLASDHLSSAADAHETLRHEILGHYGLDTFSPQDKQALLEKILASKEEPSLKPIWDDIAVVYADKSENIQAEEVFARLAEGERSGKEKLADLIGSLLTRLLRKVLGYKKGVITRRELLREIEVISKGIRNGSRPRQTFDSETNLRRGEQADTADIRFKRTADFADALKGMAGGTGTGRTAGAFTDLDQGARDFLNKVGAQPTMKRASDWVRERTERAATKLRQGIVDRYAALKELDEKLLGKDFIENAIHNSSWVLARMSSAASGAMNAMLTTGRLRFDAKERVITLQDDDASGGLGAVLSQLGPAAEVERFMGWIAANRASKLMAEGRENLFTAEEIASGKQLNAGRTDDGRSRPMLYAKVFTEFQQYRDDVLAIAEATGIISAESRAMWRDEFYVPFYRVMNEDATAGGPQAGKGLSRQEAYKKLKGGKQNLNDLLENTLMNFHHLLSASLKNQAAAQTMSNAEKVGIARVVPESRRDPKTSTFVLEKGERVFYEIDDPLVFEALTALADPGLNNLAVQTMAAFKRFFTNMTTVTPQFILANTMRDLMQASATSPTSKNLFKNTAQGLAGYRDAKTRAQMQASGGAFSFGHLYGADVNEVKASLNRTVKGAQLITDPSMIPKILRAGWRKWGDVADTAENISRAATYLQNVEQKGRLRAAYEARDIMDFSQHGAWPAVRFLIRVVPFLNARLQGLDKLYRSGVKPSLLTAMGKGTDGDKAAAARFATVTGALTVASIALYLANADDDEYRKLEDWQKDSYWFFRIGDNAFFLPKPFEVGAIATMAERLTEQMVDDKATGKLFADRLKDMLTQTFSFSPVPQMFQPVLDIYSNKDAFTGRDIESMGMDRLSKGPRSRENTTAAATALSAVSRALGDESPVALSPVQADHLIRGYFGTVGATAAGLVDTIWRGATGQESPDKRWSEYQPIRRFYRDLGAPAPYTRYSTLFYEGLREANRVYADVRELQSLGKADEAQEVSTDKRGILAMRLRLNQQQRRISEINKQMETVKRSDRDGAWKRRELDRLTLMRNRITEQAGMQIENVRAQS
ncbi:hypothetical protein EGJ44_20225 [Ectopseudomonas oleovorans]|uniref:Large polyvalent protein-associated domain-containing protein n=2 Tax=Ectopseudomonas oleovorans TaxID=301 RepID=A0A427H8S9_ECTOL|nr:hypothetical protein EGJ44_20225 [Pseudomonas oleovorans]